MRKAYGVDLICGLLIFLFLYTAFSKLLSFQAYQSVLRKSPLIGGYASFFAWGLPLLEIGIAAALFFPVTRKQGLTASLITLFLFTLYLVYMLVFVPHLPCSCGGVLKAMSWKQHLLFNLFFIFLSYLGIIFHRPTESQWHKRIPYPTREDIL